MNIEVVMLPTSDLQVDHRYQRTVNPLLVNRIAKKYNPALFSPLLVSKRNEVYYIVDGQHRLEAAKELALSEVPCFVYDNLSESDEANLFVNQQTATLFVNQQTATARLTAKDTYKANLFIGNPENIDVIIDGVLTDCGHRIASHEHDSAGWYCIVALRDTVKKIGAKGLEECLRTLNKLRWTTGAQAHSRTLLAALSHGVRKGLSKEEMVEILKPYGTPERFIAAATFNAGTRKHTLAAMNLIDKLVDEKRNGIS